MIEDDSDSAVEFLFRRLSRGDGLAEKSFGSTVMVRFKGHHWAAEIKCVVFLWRCTGLDWISPTGERAPERHDIVLRICGRGISDAIKDRRAVRCPACRCSPCPANGPWRESA